MNDACKGARSDATSERHRYERLTVQQGNGLSSPSPVRVSLRNGTPPICKDLFLMTASPSSATSFLDGFDPLSEGGIDPSDRSVFEEATRRVVQNILKSYTGFFDLFSELLQNSLDAIEKKISNGEKNYRPQLWISIDIANRIVRVTDNGSGMTLSEVRFCFRPNVSFKNRREGRGHKGVGATFLAYGFGVIRLATKTPSNSIAVRLAGGRQWADDNIGAYPRPKLEVEAFPTSVLDPETSGTSIEISIPQGVRPDLGWWGATNAAQWYELLRMKTPLGGIYLEGKTPPKVKVHFSVVDFSNNKTEQDFDFIEYPFPHEFVEVLPKTKSYDEVKIAMGQIEGDQTKIPQEFKRLDAIYGIWNTNQIVDDASPFAGQKWTAEQEELLRRHDVSVYGCFLSSAKQWGLYQKEILKIRSSPLVMKGGLLIASDFMVQGDLTVIPLTSTIGYQANTHVIVHLRDGNPDMGRKVFQPEIKSLAEDLARQVVNIFKRYLYLMRPDTGAADVVNSTDTYHWLEDKKKHRAENSIEFSYNDNKLAYASLPASEQDLVAFFHELVGMGVIKGVRFLSTSEHDRYDSCFIYQYFDNSVRYDKQDNPLGVDARIISSRESRPFVLEYKFDLDGLIADFASDKKYQNEINAVVCWKVGTAYDEQFIVRSYMVGEEGSQRQFFGATHSIWHEKMKLADVVCVYDLLRYFSEPEAVVAEHLTRFKE